MKIFISWSGEASQKYASALHDWIPSVIQSARTFISSHDIEKGERWLSSIFKKLEEIDFGIVIVTPENVTAPWVQFESGALSKNLEKSRLVPILCGVTDSDLSKNPLSSFQYVKNDKDGLKELIEAINYNCEHSISEHKLSKTFDLWWDEFESKVKEIKFGERKEKKTAHGGDGIEERVSRIEVAIDEILYNVRNIRRTRNVILHKDFNNELEFYAQNISKLREKLNRMKIMLENSNPEEKNLDQIHEMSKIQQEIDINLHKMNEIQNKYM